MMRSTEESNAVRLTFRTVATSGVVMQWPRTSALTPQRPPAPSTLPSFGRQTDQSRWLRTTCSIRSSGGSQWAGVGPFGLYTPSSSQPLCRACRLEKAALSSTKPRRQCRDLVDQLPAYTSTTCLSWGRAAIRVCIMASRLQMLGGFRTASARVRGPARCPRARWSCVCRELVLDPAQATATMEVSQGISGSCSVAVRVCMAAYVLAWTCGALGDALQADPCSSIGRLPLLARCGTD